jgi:hypothetical protein
MTAVGTAESTPVEGDGVMTAGDLGGLVRRAVEEIWNKGALDLADRLFAPAYINHGGLIPDLVRGPEAIKLDVVLCHLAFPSLQIVIEDLVADGETVAFRWTAYGTPVIPGTENAEQGLVGVTFSRFIECQITESWTFWDAKVTLSSCSPSRPQGHSARPNRSRRYTAR